MKAWWAVDLIDTRSREFGHSSWTIDASGERIEHKGVILEIRPLLAQDPEPRWRGQAEIDRLIDRVDELSGFMWHGNDIVIDDEILVGADAIRLLAGLLRRRTDELREYQYAA